MSSEQRTFSRIPVRLKCYGRVMSSIDSPQMFTGDTVGNEVDRDALFRSSKLPQELTNFLAQMDRKMDRVITLLSKDHLRSDFPMDMEILELSAAGVKFRSTESFSIDDPLEIILVLSQLPLKMAGGKGCIRGYDEDTELYRFEFLDLRGSDKEAIVQFVFQLQREQIRNSKM